MKTYFRNWGQRVADFIHKKISGREELVCADALDKITKICLKTVEDLNIILMKLDEFQTNILPVDQNKRKNSIYLYSIYLRATSYNNNTNTFKKKPLCVIRLKNHFKKSPT